MNRKRKVFWITFFVAIGFFITIFAGVGLIDHYSVEIGQFLQSLPEWVVAAAVMTIPLLFLCFFIAEVVSSNVRSTE